MYTDDYVAEKIERRKNMIMNKLHNFTRGRKFCLLLSWVILFVFFMGTRAANSASGPKEIAVETFTAVDFSDTPECWTVAINSGNIQYTNKCRDTHYIVLTHVDESQEIFTVAHSGKVVFMSGSGNVVHIIRGESE
jgi:hypothetical protein